MANLVTGLAVISDRRTKDTFQSEKLTTVSKLKTGTVTVLTNIIRRLLVLTGRRGT